MIAISLDITQILPSGEFHDLFNRELLTATPFAQLKAYPIEYQQSNGRSGEEFFCSNVLTYKKFEEVELVSQTAHVHKWSEFYILIDGVEADKLVPDGLPDKVDGAKLKEYFPVMTLDNTQKVVLMLSNSIKGGNRVTFDQVLSIRTLTNGKLMTATEKNYLFENYQGDGVFPDLQDDEWNSQLKIYEYASPRYRHEKHLFPIGIKHQSDLRPKLIATLQREKGQVVKAEYGYKNADGIIEPILYLTFNWVRQGQYIDDDWNNDLIPGRSKNDGKGTILFRYSESFYYKRDGSLKGPWKKLKEYKDTFDRNNEKKRQRDNIIKEMEKDGIDIQLDIPSILTSVKTWKDLWVDTGIGGLTGQNNFRKIINDLDTNYLTADDIILLNGVVPNSSPSITVKEYIIENTDVE